MSQIKTLSLMLAILLNAEGAFANANISTLTINALAESDTIYRLVSIELINPRLFGRCSEKMPEQFHSETIKTSHSDNDTCAFIISEFMLHFSLSEPWSATKKADKLILFNSSSNCEIIAMASDVNQINFINRSFTSWTSSDLLKFELILMGVLGAVCLSAYLVLLPGSGAFTP